MWKFANDILMQFRKCFTRQAAFKWFVIVIVALMINNDCLGITSVIRTLGINPSFYECLIQFFRADSWKLESVGQLWTRIVAGSGFVFRINGLPVLIGDGVKVSKEGRRMPGVKNHHQESGNSAKPDRIRGHMFGAIGLLLGVDTGFFCTPLSMRIHDGNDVIGEWAGDELAQESHVVRMIHEACAIACQIGESFLILDRYFLSVPVLQSLAKAEAGRSLLKLVTRAKKNVVAYELPPAKAGRGRPRKIGTKIQLSSLFSSDSASFVRTKVKMYGKMQEIEYLTRDLLWGNKLYRLLRFVLVKHGKNKLYLFAMI